MDRKNQILMSVLGVFALVIVTVGVSYAFFSYSRTGTTSNTITSGDIKFSYVEGDAVSLTNAFPVADNIGAADKAYTFTVSGKQTGDAKLTYDVTLLADNSVGENKFTNDQIKINLKNVTSKSTNGADENGFVIGTADTGVKLSELTSKDGGTPSTLTTGVSTGSCVVINDANAVEGGENYELRMWISSDLDYSNTTNTGDSTDASNDAESSAGKYNGFTYSLKVKVDAVGTNLYQPATQ